MEFIKFEKIARLNREIIITEKIDGTNAQICITEDGEFLVGSRTRWITPQDDNYGFAKWAYANKDELMTLGVGSHFGEWWGQGIQRNYSMTGKVFSLFNVSRWLNERPACCSIVPLLYQGEFENYGVMKGVKSSLELLIKAGSQANKGFMKPEGIIIYHVASNKLFKKTIDKDEVPKILAGGEYHE